MMMNDKNRKDSIMKTNDTKFSTLFVALTASANATALAYGIYLIFTITI